MANTDTQRLNFLIENKFAVHEAFKCRISGEPDKYFVVLDYQGDTVAEAKQARRAIDKAMKEVKSDA